MTKVLKPEGRAPEAGTHRHLATPRHHLLAGRPVVPDIHREAWHAQWRRRPTDSVNQHGLACVHDASISALRRGGERIAGEFAAHDEHAQFTGPTLLETTKRLPAEAATVRRGRGTDINFLPGMSPMPGVSIVPTYGVEQLWQSRSNGLRPRSLLYF